MTVSLKHAFTSAKGDGGDATLVRPSNWNAEHVLTLATQKLLGRLTAGTGAVEEISLSTYMASLLGATDAATLAGLLGILETGDVKYTFKTTASAGWVLVDKAGSIGNAASAATILASATAQALFVLIYDACSDAIAPVSGGRTGVAINDFNSGKRLTIPQLVGRAPIGAGAAGTGTSARVLGTVTGAESVTLVANQIPSLTSVNASQAITVNSTVSGIPYNTGFSIYVPSGSGEYVPYWPSGQPRGQITSTGNNSISVTYTNASQQVTSVMQPSVPLNAMVKL